ncbi:MAG TPA: glycosyltransferase family 2 protein [Thermodesulfobacteriota bacterium]|nr:glycosyltransferase family 2 protein [Thermodesulfobacteriota bacterium]
MSNTSHRKIHVSVVMPVYNEEEIIEKTVRDYHSEIVRSLPGSEMIIVNDCSTDSTPMILDRLAAELEGIKVITPPRNGGHGKALRLAYENAAKSLVFHTDSDYQLDPKDFWKLYEETGANDLVIGCRAVRHDPLPRLVITGILRLSNIVLFGYDLRDANSPFRSIKKECLDACLGIIPPDVFAPSIMLAVTARRMGYKVKEVPVTHLPRLTGEVSIRRWKLLKACMTSLHQNYELRKKLGGIARG